MLKLIPVLAVLTASSLLTGCGVSDLWKAKKINEPTDLSSIDERINVNTLWSEGLGDGTDGRQLNLTPAIDGNTLFAANAEGLVQAIDISSGHVLWEKETEEPITGGPGVGSELVLIGTGEAELIALKQSTGEEVWRKRVTSEILSTPAAAYGTAVVHTLDGKVIALNTQNGEQRWIYERKIPTLTLRGSSSPVITGTMVVSGLPGGRLVALELDNGEVIWNNVITVPSGQSQLQRLADIDGDPIIANNVVYAATYQGDVAALGEFTGTVLWKRELSAYARMASDGQQVYVGDEDGVLWALDAQTGSASWKLEDLKFRKLSAVAVVQGVVAVGDYEGYVHFISPSNGVILARTRVGSGRITSGMVEANGVLYVQNDDGSLEAISLSGRR